VYDILVHFDLTLTFYYYYFCTREGNVLLIECLGSTELVATDEEVIVPQSDFVG